jgi:hypothetical protein
MGKVLAVCLIALAGLAATAHAQVADWRTYVNERFGTMIDYPASIFRPEPPPENGDGRRFKARDGAEFTISAAYNALSYTVEALEQSLHDPASGEAGDYANVTYRLSRANLLILSGFRKDQAYYEKFLFTDDHETIHHFAIVYSSTAKGVYDPIVERMSRSMTYH